MIRLRIARWFIQMTIDMLDSYQSYLLYCKNGKDLDIEHVIEDLISARDGLPIKESR